MKRKIIKQGNDTLTLTLPIKWARANHIKPGELIDVEEQGKSLVVMPSKAKSGEIAHIAVGKSLKQLTHTIIGKYRLGADEIFVELRRSTLTDYEGNDVHVMKAIQELVNELIGMQIVKVTSQQCVIKDITTTNPSEFDTALQRTFWLVLNVAENCAHAVARHDEDALRDIPIMHHNVKQFCNYTLRLLNKFGHADHAETTYYYSLVQRLEEISNIYRHIAKHHHEHKLEKETISAIEDSAHLCRLMQRVIVGKAKTDEFFIAFDNYYRKYISAKIQLALHENLFNLRILYMFIIREFRGEKI